MHIVRAPPPPPPPCAAASLPTEHANVEVTPYFSRMPISSGWSPRRRYLRPIDHQTSFLARSPLPFPSQRSQTHHKKGCWGIKVVGQRSGDLDPGLVVVLLEAGSPRAPLAHGRAEGLFHACVVMECENVIQTSEQCLHNAFSMQFRAVVKKRKRLQACGQRAPLAHGRAERLLHACVIVKCRNVVQNIRAVPTHALIILIRYTAKTTAEGLCHACVICV